MAAIDKIYGTREQYFALRRWLARNRPRYVDWMYDLPRRIIEGDILLLSNFTTKIDVDLYFNCPLEFVRERIKEQYRENIDSWINPYE